MSCEVIFDLHAKNQIWLINFLSAFRNQSNQVHKIYKMLLSILVSIACAFQTKQNYEIDFGHLGTGIGFTHDGYEDTVSMYGIPYVEPPVGSRRFKVPELINEWGNEPLNLTMKSSYCPQLFQKARLDVFSEDCLYLNIWAPRRAIEENLRLPVQVYFHGGAFFFGANSFRSVFNL